MPASMDESGIFELAGMIDAADTTESDSSGVLGYFCSATVRLPQTHLPTIPSFGEVHVSASLEHFNDISDIP